MPSEAESTRNERDDRTIDEWQQGTPHPDDRLVSTPSETTPQALPEGEAGNGGENVGTTGDGSEPVTPGQRTFGGLSPQEAGRRSAAARRDKANRTEAEALEHSSGKVVLVRTPVAVGDIIARLAMDAKKGNTASAKELRAYMEMYPADDETDISALDARTRQQVMARVLADIVEDEGALPLEPLDSNG